MSPAQPYRVNQRPGGDFAVQRYDLGRIVRWGVYPTRQEAAAAARIANAPRRELSAIQSPL